MPRTLYPNGKPCKCGCGQPAKKNIQNGVFKGWCKYAEGHQPPPPLYDPTVRAKAHKARKAMLDQFIPVGSRRIKNVRGKDYWEVKVAGGGRWRLEHRVIVEKRIGRKLHTSEHVHHRDNNGLNNGNHADGRSNLELLSAGEHMRRTQRETPPKVHRCVCPTCGQKHIRKG